MDAKILSIFVTPKENLDMLSSATSSSVSSFFLDLLPLNHKIGLLPLCLVNLFFHPLFSRVNIPSSKRSCTMVSLQIIKSSANFMVHIYSYPSSSVSLPITVSRRSSKLFLGVVLPPPCTHLSHLQHISPLSYLSCTTITLQTPSYKTTAPISTHS